MRALATFATLILAVAGPLAGSATAGTAPERATTLTVSPRVGQISLVELSFPHAGGGRLSASELQMKGRQPTGDDYFALAALSGQPRRALLLVADRATAVMDPTHVHVTLRLRSSLGAPLVLRAEDSLNGPKAGRPGLCDLPLDGRPLTEAQVVPLGTQGEALHGIGAAEALAQAYDVTCSLAHTQALQEAVKAPDVGECPPCPAEPGKACPLAARAAICIAEPVHVVRPAAESARRAAGRPRRAPIRV